jgi:hypothetical protein
LLQNNAATLQELRFSARTLLQEDSSAVAAAVRIIMLQLAEAIAQCGRLREVKLPQCVGLTTALSHAPALQTLWLHCKANFLSTAATLNLPRCMAASPSASWCSIFICPTTNPLPNSMTPLHWSAYGPLAQWRRRIQRPSDVCASSCTA